MKRRTLLSGIAAGLAMPSVAAAQGARVLKFIPQADLTLLDGSTVTNDNFLSQLLQLLVVRFASQVSLDSFRNH